MAQAEAGGAGPCLGTEGSLGPTGPSTQGILNPLERKGGPDLVGKVNGNLYLLQWTRTACGQVPPRIQLAGGHSTPQRRRERETQDRASCPRYLLCGPD